MPTCLAALISRVPGAACTGLPSMVRFMREAIGSVRRSSLFVRRSYQGQLVLMLEGARATQVCFEFIAEFFDEGHHGHRSRVAEGAERAAEHVLRDVVHQWDIAWDTTASVKAIEQFLQPRRAFAARDAPA